MLVVSTRCTQYLRYSTLSLVVLGQAGWEMMDQAVFVRNMMEITRETWVMLENGILVRRRRLLSINAALNNK